MSKLTFSAPSGEVLENPELSDIKKLILTKGERYWNTGSGDGGFDFYYETGNANLQLIFDKKWGFYLLYRGADKKSYTSFGPGDFDHTVSPGVGGDPLLLPTKFFVPRERAWEAVEEFCKSGQKSAKITWMDNAKVKWNYGEE